MSISALQRIKLSQQAVDLCKQINAEKAKEKPNNLSLITLTRDLVVIRKQLGAAPAAAQDEPPVQEDGTELSSERDAEDELSDDPNSPNYRYKDTGYIADSRKELAANAIKLAKASGRAVKSTEIDWVAIEQNPRQAADLITKANLFGKTDWDAAKDTGMEPAAAFLIDKVYAAISSSPANNLSQNSSLSLGEKVKVLQEVGESESGANLRKDYARGLEAIRLRFETCIKVQDVIDVLDAIKDELDGVQLNSEQADIVAKLMDEYRAKRQYAKQLEDEQSELAQAWSKPQREIQTLTWEQEKRTRRKWKPDPEINARIAELQAIVDKNSAIHKAFNDAHPELVTKDRDLGEGRRTYQNDLEWEARKVYEQIRAIEQSARYFNLTQNEQTRAWLSFGDGFYKLIHFRRSGAAFAGHVTNAKNGKIADWGWAEKERATQPKKATKEEVRFQMRVAERYERKGGRDVSVQSTKQLEQMIGFRAIQSGNWVLKDPNSARFHVENTAAAMSDLSDIVGIDMNALGFGGRLGMAFGARGVGGKNAAAAHYEPTHRVVNITKLRGGGALGHEYFHAIDNIFSELVTEKAGAKKDFITTNPELIPAGAMRDAVMELRNAMMDGNVRSIEEIAYTESDIRNAKYNIDGVKFPRGPAVKIKNAGDATAAALAVEDYFSGATDKRSIKQKNQWKRIAAAYYHKGDQVDGLMIVKLKTGFPTSNFVAGAQELDGGSRSAYWSKTEEMAARAFQSYLEDKLASQDRRNDYLSAFADNKYHVDPLFGIEWKPYPEGEERKRINAAFDKLFAAIREAKVFEKAVANKPLMDAIFGEQAPEE